MNTQMESNDFGQEGSLVVSQESSAIVIASANSAIRDQLALLLLEDSFNLILVSSLEEFRLVLENENVAACLCGFHLSNCLARDLVELARRQPVQIPVVMVSAPANANEYEEYLASLNFGAYDFICHPYRPNEVRHTTWSAVKFHTELKRTQPSQDQDSGIRPSQTDSLLASFPDPPHRVIQLETASCEAAPVPQFGRATPSRP